MQENSRYHKIASRFWQDELVGQWDDDQKLLALFLLTCPHRNIAGYYWFPIDYAQADLGWPLKRVMRAFGRLRADGFIAYDEKTRVLLVRRALKYDRPTNPNQVTAAVRQVAAVPRSPLLQTLVTVAEEFAPSFANDLRKAFETVGEPLPEAVQEPLPNGLGNHSANAVAVRRSRKASSTTDLESEVHLGGSQRRAREGSANLDQSTGNPTANAQVRSGMGHVRDALSAAGLAGRSATRKASS